MGQGQSATSEDQENEAPVKQDYYELLGVDRTASDEEIKKAYRRKALELHPDRNHGNEESATKLFAEIQAAYEILADPQERAWYDSHRDVLLRGETAGGPAAGDYSYNMKLTTADQVLTLMMRFNKNVQYTDSPSGFFGGLNEFFAQLAKEEDIACQWQDLDYLDYPQFGSKEDDYEEDVKPFYGAWAGFATKKSFSWKDQYRLSDAPDRRIRRLMEKENQKMRDEAIAEYNDAVRSLVAFVRKRDPRVQNNQKSEAERQEMLRQSAQAQAARMRAKRQAEMDKHASNGISSWAHTAAKDEHEGGFSSESEVEEHEYECVVCAKTFKSEKQFHAHEKSKKHIKLLKVLKRDMRKEGKLFDLHVEKSSTNEVAEDAEDDEDKVELRKTEQPSSTLLSTQQSGDEAIESSMKAASPQKIVEASQSPGESEEDEESDYAPRAAVASRLTEDRPVEEEIAAGAADLTIEEETVSVAGSRPGKAKQKRAKKAAQDAASGSPSTTQSVCAVCGASFASKTKLFDHIRVEGHAALKTELWSEGGKRAKSKRNK